MENNFASLLSTNETIDPFVDIIEQIMSIPEESLTEQTVEVIVGMIKGAFTDKIREDSINEVIKNFKAENLTKNAAINTINIAKKAMSDAIDSTHPSEKKRNLLNQIFDIFYNIFDQALERNYNFDIELLIKLDEGGTIPTYAHETDACADLYASQDMTIPAHSLSNLVHTGLHIALPEKWVLMLDPRSSIGFKTGLRLSNSIGIIDEEYRGEIGVLYDNFSDSDYEIKAGDRIAQCWVQPVYRFKSVLTNELPTTERGEGGFGSTGK